MKSSRLILAAAGAMAVAAMLAPEVRAEDKIQVLFRPSKKFYLVGEPIEVGVYIANTSGNDLKVPSKVDLDTDLQLRTKAGDVLEKTGLVDESGGALPEVIPAGAQAARTINLLQGFPGIDKPGIYLVSWNNPSVNSRAPQIRVVPPYDSKAHYEAEVTTNKGSFRMEFFPEDAPNHVYNFVQLATCGFYDGLTFHRVVPGFVIQGGDPQGDGTGHAGYRLKAEFNDRKHEKGTVAMARETDPDSASCQFYVSLAPQPKLDGQYTVFGQVVEGMETVEAIASVETGDDERPVEPVVIESIEITKAGDSDSASEPETADGDETPTES